MIYPQTTAPTLGEETLMSKFSNEFWKNKQDISSHDVSWRLKNAEESIQQLFFVLEKALQEIEKLQKENNQ